MLAAMNEVAYVSCLLAAEESGIARLLTEGEREAAAIAARLGLHPVATRRVLDVLGSHPGEEVSLAECARRLASLRAASVESGEPHFLWDRLPDFLRSGSTLDQEIARGPLYAQVTPGLADAQAVPARRLAERLGAAQHVERILDVGAGSGVWSLALLEANPASRATALDLEEVLPRFFERATRRGLRERVEGVPGDYLQVDLPRGRYDRILAANVLHLEGSDTAKLLVERLVPVLAPGGELVVVDLFSDGSELQERLLAAYALHLALRLRNGCPHPAAQVGAWLQGAGCGPIDQGWLAEGFPLSYLRARVA